MASEILGDAGVYTRAGDPDSLARCLGEIRSSDGERWCKRHWLDAKQADYIKIAVNFILKINIRSPSIKWRGIGCSEADRVACAEALHERV